MFHSGGAGVGGGGAHYFRFLYKFYVGNLLLEIKFPPCRLWLVADLLIADTHKLVPQVTPVTDPSIAGAGHTEAGAVVVIQHIHPLLSAPGSRHLSLTELSFVLSFLMMW